MAAGFPSVAAYMSGGETGKTVFTLLPGNPSKSRPPAFLPSMKMISAETSLLSGKSSGLLWTTLKKWV
jgi:hypothetical protein